MTIADPSHKDYGGLKLMGQENDRHRGKAEPSDDLNAQGLELAATMIREVLVDFFGCLIPGFLFVMFAAPLVAWTEIMLLGQDPSRFRNVLTPAFIPSSIAFSLVMAVSYVLGFVFSRRELALPDRKSVRHILRKNWDDDWRAAVQEDKGSAGTSRDKQKRSLSQWLHILRKTREISKQPGAQFPYSHLHLYLEKRGFQDLARYVPWHSTDSASENRKKAHRSKHFINILKIRLQRWDSRKNVDIIRNEAHIRMMGSSWYAVRLLQTVYIVLLVLLTLAGWVQPSWKLPIHHLVVFPLNTEVFIVTLLIAATWFRIAIVSFLHDQRLREIVFVLANADSAYKEGCSTIFEGFWTPPSSGK